MKYVLMVALGVLTLAMAGAYSLGNTVVSVVLAAILMLVGVVMVNFLPTRPPMYSGPDRRKQQVPTHHKRRRSDMVGRDVWGGPGRYAK